MSAATGTSSEDAGLAPVSPERVLAEARRRGWLIGTAESCTGGMIAADITSVPGSSVSFLGGIVAYSEYAKTALLGVSTDTLEAYGAVSRETAVQMARGGREALGAALCVSVTGIAGPSGGTKEKPVGLVWFALDGPEGRYTEKHLFGGDRDRVRRAATDVALDLLLKYMTGELRAEATE